MSVSNVTVSARYSCNGVATTFAIPFDFLGGDLTTIKVYTITTDEGVRTLKVLTTDYTLSPAGDSPSNVIFNTAPASTVKVSIERMVPITQATNFIASRYNATAHNNALDKLTRLVQQLNQEVSRAPRIHLFDLDSGVDTEIPPLEAAAYLRVNADGDGLEWVDSLLTPGSTFDDVSPMTTEGDIIIQGTAGALRLARGSRGAVLVMGGADRPTWLAPGTLGQILTMNTDDPIWRSPLFADTSPMTTRGDMIIQGAAVAERLPKGAVGALLKMGANDPAWLAKGTAGQILRTKADGSDLEWYSASVNAAGPALLNGKIVSSVSGNALTIAVKTLAGADPSAGDPVYVTMLDDGSDSASYEVITLTSALSLTVSSGSTLGHNSSTSSFVYVYLLIDSGTPYLGISSTFYGPNVRLNTTAEGGAGGADSGATVYTSSGLTSARARALVRFTSYQGTAGTWTAPLSQGRHWPFSDLDQTDNAFAYMDTGNGHGSGSTCIRRFANVRSQGEPYISIIQDSTTGDHFRINLSGIYFFAYSDSSSSTGVPFGISVNTGAPTTSIASLSYAQGKRAVGTSISTANYVSGMATCIIPCVAGDLIRAHTNGSMNNANDNCIFMAVRVKGLY